MKLNNSMRDEIVSNAVKAFGFNEKADLIAKRSFELSEKVRLDSLGGAEVEQNMLAVEKEVELLMKKRGIPEGLVVKCAFGRDSYINAKFPGRTVEFRFSGGMYLQRSDNVPPYSKDGGREKLCGATKDYPANHEFVLEREKIINDWLDLLKQKDKIYAQTRAVVESFTTVEKLLEHWPEAKDLLPIERVNKPAPLSTNVVSLNNLIGLPK